ncbi:MAG: hypothetical protein K6E33_07285 [Lachnospiraceae bacterium]|nr:hypothetical protein [Lachnospiraceae bacterium]
MKKAEGRGLITLMCGLAVAAFIAVSAPAWLNAEGDQKTASENALETINESVATTSLNKLYTEGLLLPGATGPITKLIPKNDPDHYGVRSLLILRGLGYDYVQDIVKYGGLWFIEEDGSFAVHPLYYAVDEKGDFSVWITKAKLSDVTMDNFKEAMDLSGNQLIRSGDIKDPTEETETAEKKETEEETETAEESSSEPSEESKTPTVSENAAGSGSGSGSSESGTSAETTTATESSAASESASASTTAAVN